MDQGTDERMYRLARNTRATAAVCVFGLVASLWLAQLTGLVPADDMAAQGEPAATAADSDRAATHVTDSMGTSVF